MLKLLVLFLSFLSFLYSANVQSSEWVSLPYTINFGRYSITYTIGTKEHNTAWGWYYASPCNLNADTCEHQIFDDGSERITGCGYYIQEDDSDSHSCYRQDLIVPHGEKTCNSPYVDDGNNNCVCPSPMVESNGECVCPSGKEKFTPQQCPESNDNDSAPTCVDPCPEGLHRGVDGSCYPQCQSAWCNVDHWEPLTNAGETYDPSTGECSFCPEPSYPSADGTECVSCPAGQVMGFDGTCIDYCMAGYPFWYPTSATCNYAFTSDADGNAVTCYDCWYEDENNNTSPVGGVDNGNGSGDNNNSGGGDSGGGSNDNNDSSSGSGGGAGSGGSSGGGSGSGSGSDGFDPSGLESRATDIKNAVDNVAGKVDQVGTKIDSVKTSVDSIGSKIDESNEKLDRIGNLLDSNVTFSFTSLVDQFNEAKTNINDSITTVKNSFDNAKAVLEGEKTYTMPTGSFSGWDLTVYDETVHINPCPMFASLHPFIAIFTQFMFVLFSVYVLLWGFKF